MADFFGTMHRVQVVNPYTPARTELLGNNTGQFGANDVGKPVKLSGDTCVLCAAGDEIYGFIESVEPGTSGGYSIGGVLSDSGHEMYATDEDGDLTVGDLVVAGTAVALGTANAATGPNVDGAAGTEDGIDRWRVVAVYTTPANQVLIRKL
jgi:hypothetical protein